MAKLITNGWLESLRGKLGGVVIRKIRGKFYISEKGSSPRKSTAAQKAHRAQFSKASAYAREVQKNPELLAFYAPFARKLDLRIRAVAISDWFDPPTVVST